MKTRVIKIGNSQGIRIPKPLLDQIGLDPSRDSVELTVEDDRLVIQVARRPREGWEAQFRLMAERGDDQLLDPESVMLTERDDREWEW